MTDAYRDWSEAMDAIAIARTLRGCRFTFTSERELQEGIGIVLDRAGYYAVPEVRLGRFGRIDFLAGGVGIEVKIGGSFAALLRQLFRYAECPRVRALVAITSRRHHDDIPETILGKPVHVVTLEASAL